MGWVTTFRLLLRPHSLGILIEWKRYYVITLEWCNLVAFYGPHSLGILIEWKQKSEDYKTLEAQMVPTRWGY